MIAGTKSVRLEKKKKSHLLIWSETDYRIKRNVCLVAGLAHIQLFVREYYRKP